MTVTQADHGGMEASGRFQTASGASEKKTTGNKERRRNDDDQEWFGFQRFSHGPPGRVPGMATGHLPIFPLPHWQTTESPRHGSTIFTNSFDDATIVWSL